MSADTLFTEESEEEPRVVKRDEQMSPVAVVLYVVFFYIVWQILTRSDDNEILSHLPPSSPLLAQQQHAMEQRPSPPSNYHLPYPMPQIAASIPSPSSESTSTWRVVLHAIVFPLYFAVTLLAIPLPFLLNAINLLASILSSILYPVTSTARLMARTFIIAPLNVVLGIMHALYPVYVFVGGVLGVGAVLGVAAGWIGRLGMWVLLGRKSKPKKTKKRRSKREEREREREVPREYEFAQFAPQYERDYPEFEFDRRFVPIVELPVGDGGTAREAVILGLRRRGMNV